MNKALIFFGLFFSSTIFVFGQVTSDFNTNAEGWTVFDNNTGVSTPATYNSTGGNPGGNALFTTSSGALNMYWTAPAKFLGNQSLSYNQTLSFDLDVSTAGADNSIGDVRLVGSSGIILFYQLPTKPLASQWNSYSVQLNESQWHVSSPAGPLATINQIKSVLVNMTTLQIRAKYLSGNTLPYTVQLDNVVLDQMTLLAAPVITSFTPLSALAGTNVTITGSNFNATASQNSVYFKGVKAVVTSATTTQLVVKVPVSAPYGKLTVENKGTGLQGISTQSFSLLFDNNKDFGGLIIPASMTRGYSTLLQNGTETGSTNNQNGNMDTGDLDGDGWVDLIATETGVTSAPKIYLYRNLGLGGTVSVSSFAAPISLSIATIPGGSPNLGELMVADVDSDGLLDIAAVSSSGGLQGYLVAFRNTSTAGTISFASPEFFGYPYYSSQLTTTSGDFDGDGRIDFVYTTGTSPGGIWMNQNLSTPGNIDFSYGFSVGTNASHRDLAVGDLNADGKPELIASLGNAFEVYQNNSTAGSIAFNAPFPVTNTLVYNMGVADLDADSKLDLVWGDPASANLYFSRNIYSGSALDATSFGAAIQVANSTGSTEGIAISDINSDGKPDVIVSGVYDLSILENQGTGGALNAATFPHATLFQGSGGGQPITATTPVVADLDGDNKPEVMFVYTYVNVTAPEKGIYIFHNESFPCPRIDTMTPSSGIVGASVNFVGDHFSTGLGFPPVFGRLGKIATAILPSSNTSASGVVTPSISGRFSFTEHGLTAYSKPFSVLFNTNQTINSSSFGPSIDFAMTAGTIRDALDIADFDDDGRVDVVVIDNASKIFKNSQATPGQAITTSSLTVQGTTYSSGYNLIALDIDGDGKTDLNSGGGLLQNTSSGSISFTSVTSTAGGFTTSSFADFNKDGKTDLVFTNGSLNVQIYENLSRNGSFTPNGTFQNFGGGAINLVAPAVPYSAAAADFDGDGYEDIISVNPNGANNSTYFLNNKISGRLSTASFSSLDHSVSGLQPYDVTANDFDGDGKIDIAITYFNSAFVSVLLNNSVLGNISFTGTDVAVANKGYKITSQDLDGDGKAEVVVIHQPNPGPGSFTVLQNKCSTGTVSFTATNFPITRNPQAVKIADINSDSKPDILIVANSGTVGNALMVFENKINTGPVITVTLQPSDAAVCDGAMATFNADATGTTNITYQWQFSPNTGVFTDIANGTGYTGADTKTLSVNTAGNFGAGDYRCKVSGDLAPDKFSNAATLTVNIVPAAPTTTGDSDCVPASLTLSASGGTNGQYRWYDIATGGTADASQKNSTFNTPVISITTTYYVSINNGSCEGPRTPVDATISPLAKPILQSSVPIVSGTINLCAGDVLTLTAPAGFVTYAWSNGATTNPITISISTSALTLQVTDGSGCSSPPSDALDIVVNPYPVAIITANGTELTASLGDSYQWYQNGNAVPGATSQTFEFDQLEYGAYAVDVTDNGCTSNSGNFIYLVTGLEKNSNGLKIYPNPVDTDLFVEYKPSYQVSLMDVTGKVVKKVDAIDYVSIVDVSTLSQGLYLLKITDSQKTQYFRVTKK